MSLPSLSVIPAAAGAGKTFTIQKRLARWIVDGDVRPDRILAVTFGEAAAGELRERLLAELLDQGLLDAALDLERATLTTIHGFGLRILQGYCFEAGISPDPRLLSEEEKEGLMRHALAETDKADAVLDNLSAFGYRYRGGSGTTAEEFFRQAVLKLVNLVRIVDPDSDSDRLVRQATEEIRQRYGSTADALPLERALRREASELLDAFPAEWSKTISPSAAAVKDFRSNHRDLTSARDGDRLHWDWTLWQRLRTLRISGKGVDLPEAYVEHAKRVMEAANGILRHPGPLDRALVHAESLFGAAQDSLARYARDKRGAGLLDYMDMLSMAAQLLCRDASVLGDIAAHFDCVVIDEFQDTNPLQFSLLWAVHRAGVPALVVGDRKQSITGFQHADARLMAALEEQNRDVVEPLTGNWRTRGDLLEVMNEIGQGLFGDDYQALAAMANLPSTMEPLELIDLHAKGQATVAHFHLAFRIHALLEDPTQRCFDARSGSMRRLRGEDIAVLCPTHAILERYADALRGLGIRVRIVEQGWFESRVVQLACHALAYVADPDDRHTRLYLAATELGSRHTLESALRILVEGETIEDPLFESLRRIHSGPVDRTVVEILDESIAALDLYDICSAWPDGNQARANLKRLRAEAQVFVEAHGASLAAAGYYGGSLEAFLIWIEDRGLREGGQPEPQVIDERAVHLCTWHKAKGREWPVVAVCGTDRKVGPRLPEAELNYRSFEHLETILEETSIRYSPSFDIPELEQRFSDPLRPAVQEEARRLLYVALTRAKEKLILEWPSRLEGKGGVTLWSILREASAMHLDGETLKIGDRDHPVRVTRGGGERPSEYDRLASSLAAAPRPAVRQRIEAGVESLQSTPESITPSSLAGSVIESPPPWTTRAIAPALDLEAELLGAARGDLLHRCLEVLNGDPKRLEWLDGATGHALSGGDQKALAATVEAFESWVEKELTPVSLAREVPVLARRADGGVIHGSVDLLVEAAHGYWILDYKSDRIGDPASGFEHYLPQLLAYGEAIPSGVPDKKLLGVGVFWLATGQLTLAELTFRESSDGTS